MNQKKKLMIQLYFSTFTPPPFTPPHLSQSFRYVPVSPSFCPHLSSPLQRYPYLSMHHNQTSLLIHVALGYHFISLLLFLCEVTAVWLALDSAPPSHPHYIFTLCWHRTDWYTGIHIFVTQPHLYVLLFIWSQHWFLGVLKWKTVHLFHAFFCMKSW